MNLETIRRRMARLEAEAEERKQEEAYGVTIVFYLPDIEGESIPADAPPLEANGMRPYRVYLPVKKPL